MNKLAIKRNKFLSTSKKHKIHEKYLAVIFRIKSIKIILMKYLKVKIQKRKSFKKQRQQLLTFPNNNLLT